MTELINSLKRLYATNKINESAVIAMFERSIITELEKDYILRKDG